MTVKTNRGEELLIFFILEFSKSKCYFWGTDPGEFMISRESPGDLALKKKIVFKDTQMKRSCSYVIQNLIAR